MQKTICVFSQIGYTNTKIMFDDVYKIIETSFTEHKKTFQNDQMRDFMDVFIKQINTAEQVRFKKPQSPLLGTTFLLQQLNR